MHVLWLNTRRSYAENTRVTKKSIRYKSLLYYRTIFCSTIFYFVEKWTGNKIFAKKQLLVTFSQNSFHFSCHFEVTTWRFEKSTSKSIRTMFKTSIWAPNLWTKIRRNEMPKRCFKFLTETVCSFLNLFKLTFAVELLKDPPPNTRR